MLNIIVNPNQNEWENLCQRPTINQAELRKKVEHIFSEVKKNGDKALVEFALKFDNVKIDDLLVSSEIINHSTVDKSLKKSIETAFKNIKKFHLPQLKNEKPVETSKGVLCWRKSVAIEKVGIYIPGGTAPLFSTVLMLAIPAKICGCKEIVLCTPPGKNGQINPSILYASKLAGVTKIVKAGGAQAIAAMAYGTESVPKVSKIFGPGNQYVTMAKLMIQQDGVAIDMPAGPSEVLVIADNSANPKFIAADLLSQAEHGNDSQVIFVTNSLKLAGKVNEELSMQMKQLARMNFAQQSLQNSVCIVFKKLDDAINFSNHYAPEHLIINTRKNLQLQKMVVNAGSVFIGPYSCESAGDYASGTNHTLPTSGFAKAYSGVSCDSFVRKITFQKLTKSGLNKIGKAIEVMASNEGLDAHKNAVTIRLKK